MHFHPPASSTTTITARLQHQQNNTSNDLIGGGEQQRRMSFGSEIALQHGVHFEGKYIGSMEITRPGTRIEIVAAMRRVRYEFKARNIKKRPVDIVVSVDGVKVVLQRRKKRQKYMDESKMMVMSHPMYRIYYVAHDLYDPQIFCYVARDGASNSFKCNVFKCAERDQAIAVVRTIGQAFELCNRMAQEQTRERQMMEQEERVADAAAAGAVASTSRAAPRESLASTAERGRSSSPTSIVQARHTSPGAAAKRQSIFVPKRRAETDHQHQEEEGEQRAGDGDDERDEEGPDQDSIRDSFDHHHAHQPGPSSKRRSSIRSGDQLPPPHLQLNIPPAAEQIPQQAAMLPPLPTAYPATANPAPPLFHQPPGTLWNIPQQPQPLLQHHPQLSSTLFGAAAPAPGAQLVQSVDANGNPLYSIVPPPATMSLSSPLLISPYATLQLPASASLASTSSAGAVGVDLQQLQSPNSESAQRMIRSQLEQAQQSAQVAACQVQLLRDQLSTETTARLEAQSKTHQLLNSNRELLEQVQQLVGRLQVMENRMAEGLMNHLGSSRNDIRGRGRRRGPDEEAGLGEEAGPSSTSELRPYQMKALSDLRAGSLPAGGDGEGEAGTEIRRRGRGRKESGAGGTGVGMTEDEAAASEEDEEEDTDVNLSERLELPGPSRPSFLRKLVPAVPSPPPPPLSSSTALALGMPLLFGAMQNRVGGGGAGAYNPGRRKAQQPQPVQHAPETSRATATMANDIGGTSKKALRRFSLQPTELEPGADPHQPRIQKKGGGSKGVFGKMEFKRMSFNPNPNKKVAEDKSLISVPPVNATMYTEGGEELYSTERRNSRTSPEKQQQQKQGSPDRYGRRRSSLGGLGRLLAPNK